MILSQRTMDEKTDTDKDKNENENEDDNENEDENEDEVKALSQDESPKPKQTNEYKSIHPTDHHEQRKMFGDVDIDNIILPKLRKYRKEYPGLSDDQLQVKMADDEFLASKEQNKEKDQHRDQRKSVKEDWEQRIRDLSKTLNISPDEAEQMMIVQMMIDTITR
jgi:hypothetical protein